MTNLTSEIDKQIMHLCEVMGIDRDQIRYVMTNGVEFIGEAIKLDEDTPTFGDNDETTYFHPMKINIDIDVNEDGHLCSQKYFSPFNPYSDQPYVPIKNYNILNQTPIFPDLMLEYLSTVYEIYFSVEGLEEQAVIESSLNKNNVVYMRDYRRKK